jgi:tetratricopeptide (TPR) repeat protein
LDSWKDIAAYLKRNVSTVQRWEKHEGLPVRRHFHKKGGTVFAYRSELDEWQRRRAVCVETTEGRSCNDVDAPGSEVPGRARKTVQWIPIGAALAGLAVIVALLATDWASGLAKNPFAPDAATHQEYVLGRYYLSKQNRDDVARAIDHFTQAVRIAPAYAPAYAALSDAWWVRGIWGGQTLAEVESESRIAAQKALAANPETAQAHVSLGRIKYTYDRDWAGAEAAFRRALALDPDCVDAHYFYAMLLMGLGRFSEAIDYIDRASQLDPVSSMIQSGYGRVLYRARQYDPAIERFERAIALEPRNISALNRLGDAYTMAGSYPEALATYEKAHRLGSNDRVHILTLARVYARMGRAADARRMLDQVKSPPGIHPVVLAKVYAALGDSDKTFELLFEAVDNSSEYPLLLLFSQDPDFDGLRADVRWGTLLTRLNLGASVSQPGVTQF